MAGDQAHDGLSAAEVDDAIYSLAASLRSNPRRPLLGSVGGMSADGGDDAEDGHSAPAMRAGDSLSATVLAGGGPYGAPNQPVSAAQRQRCSAREGDRLASSCAPFTFSKDGPGSGSNGALVPAGGAAGGNGAAAAQSLAAFPRTWHSHAHASGSRPRSVEGGMRALGPTTAGQAPTRRAAYYQQQPSADPRLVLHPNGGSSFLGGA